MAHEAKPRPVIDPPPLTHHTRKLEAEIFGMSPTPPRTENHAPLTSPFNAYSLRGTAAEFEDRATDAVPLLGDICLSGQATILYAQPNSGKTLVTLHLLIEAVRAGRIEPDAAYYLNADDGSKGFADKLRIADTYGIHTLAPGFKGFKAAELLGLLRRSAAEDKARRRVVIIDMLKKFTSLMKKGRGRRVRRRLSAVRRARWHSLGDGSYRKERQRRWNAALCWRDGLYGRLRRRLCLPPAGWAARIG